MGTYTDQLFKKNRARLVKSKPSGKILTGYDRATKPVRLVECGIRRDGVLHQGFRSHSQIRVKLGDEDAYETKRRPNDEEGFITSDGRFVSRREGARIAAEAGQTYPEAATMSRDFLSSEIDW